MAQLTQEDLLQRVGMAAPTTEAETHAILDRAIDVVLGKEGGSGDGADGGGLGGVQCFGGMIGEGGGSGSGANGGAIGGGIDGGGMKGGGRTTAGE